MQNELDTLPTSKAYSEVETEDEIEKKREALIQAGFRLELAGRRFRPEQFSSTAVLRWYADFIERRFQF